MLRFLARFLAVVLAAAFVLTAVGALFLRPLGTRLLAPDTYRQVAREQHLAERFPALAAEMLDKAAQSARHGTAAPSSEDFAGFLGGFTRPDLQALLTAVLPPDYVQGQLDAAVDQLLAYVSTETPRPELRLALLDVKRRLVGGVLEDAYVQLLQSKPPCTTLPDGLPTTCCPPADRLPEVRERFREMISPAVREMPDSVDLFTAPETEQGHRIYAAMHDLRGSLRTFGVVARWCWVVPLLLLLGVALFAVRSLRGGLLWLGLPCLLAGGVGLVFALPGAAMGDWVFRWFVAPHLPGTVPALAIAAVLGVVTSLAQIVFGAAMKAALALLLGGAAALVAAFFLKPKTAAAR